MMNSELNAAFESCSALVDGELAKYLQGNSDSGFPVLNEAERYTVMSGGKRIRPFLTLEFCRAYGGNVNAALPFACAVEMIHSYSLIHDDLPCMDNDDMRRGKPSNHIKFGYANALLAGDGLLTDAFGVVSGNAFVSPAQIKDAVTVLSAAAGSRGMVGGQVMDLSDAEQTYEILMKIHEKKTACLICAAASLGCIAAGLDENERAPAREYAYCIGMTFQIIDDILDAGNGEEGPDNSTVLSFMTVGKASALALKLTEKGKAAIAGVPDNRMLLELADYLLKRNK